MKQKFFDFICRYHQLLSTGGSIVVFIGVVLSFAISDSVVGDIILLLGAVAYILGVCGEEPEYFTKTTPEQQ